MKKSLLLLCVSIFFGGAGLLKAQCYGTIHYDQSSSANGNSSFTISTTFCNELILISYDGWVGPGTGPVKVDGNAATHLATANVNLLSPSSGAAETYAYIAPAAGVHNIVCTETGNFNPYYLNQAADFYVTGTSNPLTIASLTFTTNTTACQTGGPVTGTINTVIPNSYIYTNIEWNTGIPGPDPVTFVGGTHIGDFHIGNGITVGDAYTAATSAGAYSITGTNTANNSACGGSDIILVAIPPPLCTSTMSVTTVDNPPSCGNNNGNIIITAIGGTPPYTYTWTPAVSTTASASNLSAGTYSIVVSDGACPPDDTTLVFNFTGNSLTLTPTVTANDNCFGNCDGAANVTIVGGSAPFTYAWAPSGGTNAAASNLCAGVYTVAVADINGCHNTASVIITEPTALTVTDSVANALCNGGVGSILANPLGGTPPYMYSWSPSAQTNRIATGLSAGTYTTNVTDANGCTATATGTITQPTALTANITGALSLCVGQTDTLTANVGGGATPYTYTWSNAATTSSALVVVAGSQTVTVNITDANGCIIAASFTVTTANPPTISVSATRYSICEGSSTHLEAIATNISGSYNWQPGNLSGPVVNVTPTVTTTYTVTAPSQCGLATATITINVNQLPTTAFSVDNGSGCIPFCAQFRDRSTSASGNIIQWAWSFGNGDSLLEQSPIFCYSKSGSYPVTLTTVTDSGCSSTLQRLNFVTVYSSPVASFSSAPQPTTIINSAIQFTDQSTDAYGIATWTWNFGVAGNDTLSYLQNPSYKYWDTGSYCVNEVVMNIHGCVDTATNCLVINPIFSMYIPSAFSPNGDGKNEIFMARGNDVKSFEMYIFDRWGMQLFHSTNIDNGWNGTVNGGSSVSQEDTYVYLINAYDNKNQKHSYLAKVYLIK